MVLCYGIRQYSIVILIDVRAEELVAAQWWSGGSMKDLIRTRPLLLIEAGVHVIDCVVGHGDGR